MEAAVLLRRGSSRAGHLRREKEKREEQSRERRGRAVAALIERRSVTRSAGAEEDGDDSNGTCMCYTKYVHSYRMDLNSSHILEGVLAVWRFRRWLSGAVGPGSAQKC
jgi:hypothetical protein